MKRLIGKKLLKGQFLFILVAGLTISFFQGDSSQKSASEIKVQIVADVNRDGKVEFEGDNKGKNTWTLERGAIFFNNNDSDQNTKTPDHADAVVNGPEDLRDLAVLKIRKIPDLPQNSQIVLSVDDASLDRVRLFLRTVDNDYKPLNLKGDGNIDLTLLRQRDLELRIEANSYADKFWSGETEVTVYSALKPE